MAETQGERLLLVHAARGKRRVQKGPQSKNSFGDGELCLVSAWLVLNK